MNLPRIYVAHRLFSVEVFTQELDSYFGVLMTIDGIHPGV